ncbi:MAG TPA: LacI family DNA-binding transcriptional regulator [Solirubrobacteraceae bacterium]|nr:LacI family DNA-binding transcriptional regulator [Solirubrobacteraceae bacterium]
MTTTGLDEIAKRANVSPSTVSRVINNRVNVSIKTRERVLTAMRELDVGLASKGLVALIIPDGTNPFFTSLGFVFQEIFDKVGLQVVTASSEGRADRELALVNKFKGLGLRGLIYISAGQPSPTILQAVASDNVPVVVFDRHVEGVNLDYVAVNNKSGIQGAVDYLVSLGHSRIGHLKGLAGARNAADRVASFEEALATNQLDVNPDWLWEGNYRFGSGRECAERLLAFDPQERPSAVFCANDAMAIGLIQRLKQEGWVIPRDLSVIGFDGIDAGDWIYPRLTTIEQPVHSLAWEATQCLMERIRGLELDPRYTATPKFREIQPLLIPRESVGPPPARFTTRVDDMPVRLRAITGGSES